MIAALPWLAGRAARTPHAIALRVGAESLDWATLAIAVERRAATWRLAGVERGDVVGVLLPNGRRFVESVHASAAIGTTLLPLDPRQTRAEIEGLLRDARTRWLLHPAPESDMARLLSKAVANLDLLPEPLEGPVGAWPCAPLGPGDVRALLYTSGTTGRPKGVELTHANFHANASASARILGPDACERWLAVLPLFHVGGLAILTRSVLLGGAVVVHERFDPEAVGRAVERDGITGASLVPTMLLRVLDARKDAPPPATLRAVLLGGGPIEPALLERAWRAGWPVLPTYGLTEATSQVATLPLDQIGKRPDRVGRALPGISLRIVDTDGRPVPAGHEGEIQVRGPTVMRGYRDRPAETAQALRGGWLHTGDLGVLDAAGFLRVLARRSDLIVSGGENVYPAEVEAALLAHPAVAEAGVAPVPDAEHGQRVEAWVVLRPGTSARAEALVAFCRKRLAGYKVPRAFHFVGELPRTASGKLLRRRLGGC